MYQWVRPEIAIPVHGEMRHLVEHAKLARECQVPQALVVENGAMVRLAPAPAGIIEQVQAGRLALEGTMLLPLDSGPVQSRRRLMRNGAAVVALVADKDGRLRADPAVTFQGVVDGALEADMLAAAIAAARTAAEELGPRERRDDTLMREAVRIAVRRLLHDRLGKRPQTDVQLIRI
jgi:ribonuclease J